MQISKLHIVLQLCPIYTMEEPLQTDKAFRPVKCKLDLISFWGTDYVHYLHYCISL